MTARLRGVSRDFQRLLYDMEKEGWQASETSGGHIKLKHPTCGFVICSKTASDRRALERLKSDIRKQLSLGAEGFSNGRV